MRSFTFLACLSLMVSASCGSEGPSTVEISGVAHKGPLDRARIHIHRVNEDGTRGDLLATTETGARGLYAARVHRHQRLEVVARRGRYVDEATGRDVELRDSDELRVLVDRDSDRGSIVITPLTTIASDRARTRYDRGEDQSLDDAIREGARDVTRAFDLDGVDIRRDHPTDLTRQEQVGTDSRRYGAVLAGLSQEASDRGLEVDRLLDLVDHISEDLRDGVIDGSYDGDDLSRADLPSPEDVRDNLDSAVDDFINSDRNESGTTHEDLDHERSDALGDSTPDDGSTDHTGDSTTTDASSSGDGAGTVGDSDPAGHDGAGDGTDGGSASGGDNR